MTSKSILAIALRCNCPGSGSALAETYQWKDSSGQTVVSDTPPPPQPRAAAPSAATSPAVVSEKPAKRGRQRQGPAKAPKPTAEKDMEFKKRQQEAKEKADKQAKEQAAEAEKRDNCERAKRNLTALENNQPMVTLDENGQRKVMDTDAAGTGNGARPALHGRSLQVSLTRLGESSLRGVGITGALFHYLALGRTLLANLFGVCDERPIDFDAIPVAQHGIELGQACSRYRTCFS